MVVPEENSYLCPSKPDQEGRELTQNHTILYKDRNSSTWRCESLCLKETGLHRVLVEVSVNVGVIQLISQNCTP